MKDEDVRRNIHERLRAPNRHLDPTALKQRPSTRPSPPPRLLPTTGGPPRPCPFAPTRPVEAPDIPRAPRARPTHLYNESGVWWTESIIDDTSRSAFPTIDRALADLRRRFDGVRGAMEIHFRGVLYYTFPIDALPSSLAELVTVIQRAELEDGGCRLRWPETDRWSDLTVVVIPT